MQSNDNDYLKLIAGEIEQLQFECMGPIVILPDNTWKDVKIHDLQPLGGGKFTLNDPNYNIIIDYEMLTDRVNINEKYYIIDADIEDKE